MKIAFVMDPLEKLRRRWDTSSSLAAECQRRGWKVFTCTPADLHWAAGGVVANLTRTKFSPGGARRVGSPKPVSLSTMNVVWMRKDPPVDLAYLTACQLLAQIPRPTVVVNNPQSLQTLNEKLFPLDFPKWIPPTLVSRSPAQLRQFLRRQKGKLVLKPLHQRGGRGVRLVRKIPAGRQNDFILAQAFLPAALTQGNKRVLFVDGRLLGVFLRTPPANPLRGEPVRGETELPTRLTRREKAICQSLSAAFRKHRLFFVGIDLIQERLIEINITSPAGIPELNAVHGGHFEKRVIDALCRKFFRGRQ